LLIATALGGDGQKKPERRTPYIERKHSFAFLRGSDSPLRKKKANTPFGYSANTVRVSHVARPHRVGCPRPPRLSSVLVQRAERERDAMAGPREGDLVAEAHGLRRRERL
jgi:hypothetical protein